MRRTASRAVLKSTLDALYERYARPEFLSSDPLEAAHRYADPVDQAIAGFLAASFAFGRVDLIRRAMDQALKPLGPNPAQTLAAFTADDARAASEGFNYRWIRAEDLANAFIMLGHAVANHGGLEPLFTRGMTPDDPDTRGGATTLVAGLREGISAAAQARRGTMSFLPATQGPGAAKRLHMFLRWMVRPAGVDVDLGLWDAARPDQLIMPLDTHVARISRYIGLTERKSPGLKMALEITEALRAIHPEDPVRYDFAVARLGILGACPKKRHMELCAECDLIRVCRL